MRFSNLTEKDITTLLEIYNDKSISYSKRLLTLSEMFGIGTRQVSVWVKNLGNFPDKNIDDSPQLRVAMGREYDKKSKRFIITWAQNNTPIHEQFFKNVKAYAEFIKADLHVIAGRYINPTSVWAKSDDEDTSWHDDVLPYLDANRHDVHKYLSVMSDVKVRPTAVNPMTGMEGMSGINSCVFGSPKVQLSMIPVLEGNAPKMMVTTGACTVKNYIDSKAGKKGEFHHTYGFVIIEIKNEEVFFMRQVTATEDGSFTDLYHKVEQEKVTELNKIAAIVWGDLHSGQHDERVVKKTFELMERVKPDHVILHDVFDGFSISHHDEKDPFLLYKKEMKNDNSLKREIEMMLKTLEPFTKYNTVIVRSNHDDFLDRWLKNTDWRKAHTLKNSLEYMQYAATVLSGLAPNGVIPWVINERYPDFKTLGRSDSYLVKGWELGQHGDIGASGSRGSVQQFRKLNTKIIVGHYHSPERKDGSISVGTSTKLRLGYNIGPSSWLQSHVIIHEDGCAQHINFIKGEFTTLK